MSILHETLIHNDILSMAEILFLEGPVMFSKELVFGSVYAVQKTPTYSFYLVQVDVWAFGVIMYGLANGRSTRSGVETHERFGGTFPPKGLGNPFQTHLKFQVCC